MASFTAQIQRNSVALISLVIAVSTLGYNTWRNETTEHQRNLRHASFRVLETLGELQEVVDYRYYYLPFETAGGQEGSSRLQGYGNVALIKDLMGLMPEPAPAAGNHLQQLWSEHFNTLDDVGADGSHSAAAKRAEQNLTDAINTTRNAVVQVLKDLE